MTSDISFHLKKDSTGCTFKIPRMTKVESARSSDSLHENGLENISSESETEERYDKGRSVRGEKKRSDQTINQGRDERTHEETTGLEGDSWSRENSIAWTMEDNILLIKTIPLSMGHSLHASDVNEHFNKFGSVVQVEDYGLPTGQHDRIIILPGHYLVEFAYALGLESALCGGKIQKINSVLGHSVNVKLFKMTSHLESIIASKTLNFRMKKLTNGKKNHAPHSISRDSIDSNNNLSSA